MSTGDRRVRDEEAALWQRVARDVEPLAQHADPPEDDATGEAAPPPPPPEDDATGEAAPPPPPPAVARKARKGAAPAAAPLPPRPSPALPRLDPVAPAGLDRRTARRLKRGQLAVEARLDLHGKTQDQAHDALRRFIRESRMARRRCVQIITGKGSVASGEGGVLRRMTPRWLNEPGLRRHIVAIANAPASGGGAGALYVLLKSREPLDPDQDPGQDPDRDAG